MSDLRGTKSNVARLVTYNLFIIYTCREYFLRYVLFLLLLLLLLFFIQLQEKLKLQKQQEQHKYERVY